MDAATREIPPQDWDQYLPTFSDDNKGRPVRLETRVVPGESEPLLAECQPLLGVSFDKKGSAAPAVLVTLGGLEPQQPNFSHVISDPTRMWVEEDVDALPSLLTIESREEIRTLLFFEPLDALAETA